MPRTVRKAFPCSTAPSPEMERFAENPDVLQHQVTVQKRVCKPLEAVPNEVDARLIDSAMELDLKQKVSSGCGPWATKTKPSSMIFENQGSRGAAQPCPRCIAGESGHFSHILGC